MARHMAKVEYEEQLKNYLCGTCNNNFASKCVLGKLIKRVHPVQVLSFQSPRKKKGVAQHMSCVHSGKLLCCANCGKTFRHKANLNTHVKKCTMGAIKQCAMTPFESGRK